ncbi:ABI gene family member 3 [Aix galericulata]|nr:ABI gene family member 3 [Aix galericulata]
MGETETQLLHAAPVPCGALFPPLLFGGEFAVSDDLEPPLLPPPALPDFEDFTPPLPPDVEEPPWVPASYLEKVVTLYPYAQQKDNEFSFQPGALIYVTRRYSDGWCEGVMGEETPAPLVLLELNQTCFVSMARPIFQTAPEPEANEQTSNK